MPYFVCKLSGFVTFWKKVSADHDIRLLFHFQLGGIINNYWMRLSMISWIIKTEVCVSCRSRRLRQIAQTRGFDNSWYHAKTEFNNCFIIHFSHNSSSETETKRSAILFLRRTLEGAKQPGRRWTWHDKCNICSRYCIYHVKFTSYCELIECSRPIRFFIVSVMYDK